jgi:asparagine synthase (glutamine-hydrolysing)
MGIWHISPVGNVQDSTLFEKIPLPRDSSKCINLDTNRTQSGLLARPNPAAFLSFCDQKQQISIAVDGRIHNARSLCRTLHLDENEDAGRIITLLYEQYGPAGLYRLEGAFSLILVDLQRKTTLLYRSFLTGFPLYYSTRNNVLSVSTNPMDILRRPDIDAALSMEQISGFFSLDLHGWTGSIFSEIDEVDYGEMVTISPGEIRREKRSPEQIFMPPGFGSDAEMIQQYRHLLDRAIAKNMVAGAEHGIMLSSGMDSGSLAALAAAGLAEKNSTLRAYSWSLPNYKTGDETDKIKELCAALKIQLTLFNGEEHAPFSRLNRLQLLPDIPFNNIFQPMISELYRLASKDGITVLFNGHFGDAIFPLRESMFIDIIRNRRFELLVPEWKSMVRDQGLLQTIKSLPAVRQSARYLRPFRTGSRRKMPEWLSDRAKESLAAAWKNRRPYAKKHPRFSQLLSKMATGSGVGRYITGRYGLDRVEPYIDLELLNYTLHLPAYMAYRGGQKKYIAREAMRGLLPESIRTQVKYNVGDLSRFAIESFLQRKAEVRERIFDEPDPWKVYIDSNWMEKTFKKNKEINGQELLVIWMSLHLGAWQRAIQPGGSLYEGR